MRILLIFLLLAPQEDIPEIARSLMEEAERAREAGRNEDAIGRYERVIETAPRLASAYANLGALHFKMGNVEQAYQTFVRGVEVAPSDRTLLSNAAASAQQLGKSAEALTFIDRALTRNPRDAALHSLRATILRSLERPEDALAALRQSIQLEPRDSRHHFALGNLLYQTGSKKEAIEAYRRATDLDRSNLRAYYNLGAVLFDTGRFDEALKAYKVALEPIERSFARNEKVEPIHAQAYMNLGAIYLRQQQWQPALDAYQKALALDANNATARYNLGFIYFNTRDYGRAKGEYEAALAADPSLPLAYLHLAQIAAKAGDHSRAAELLRSGMSRMDAESRLIGLRLLARSELARGNQSEARAAFEEALRAKSDDAESMIGLARLHRRQESFREAKALLEGAQRLAADQTEILLEHVLLSRAAGETAAERSAIEQLLRLQPNHPQGWALRAELFFLVLRQGWTADTRRQLDALLVSPPPGNEIVATLRMLRALSMAQEGQTAEAAREVSTLSSPTLATAAIDAWAGRRQPAMAAFEQLAAGRQWGSQARGNLGLLLWQVGRHEDALPHLTAALSAHPDWREVAAAAGEIAFLQKDFDKAIDLLGRAGTCEAPSMRMTSLGLEMTLATARQGGEVCTRAREVLAAALLTAAGDDVEGLTRRQHDLSAASMRQARQQVDRALALPLDPRTEGLALFLRGTLELLAGSEQSARETLNRALTRRLPEAAAVAARRNLAAIAEAARQPATPQEPTTSDPRRTVVVFLPDAPAENEKRLAEAMSALIGELSAKAGLTLQTEFFRRLEDARGFVESQRNRVGVVITNRELLDDLGSEFRPRYQLAREGRLTYRRVLIVPSDSSIREAADAGTAMVSLVEGLRDSGLPKFGSVLRVPDDLTAAANVLLGRTDAAVVSEANPLLAQNLGRKLRVVHTSAPLPMPVIAFAPMPERDRAALDDAFGSLDNARTLMTPIQMTSIVRLGESAPAPAAKRIEVAGVSVAALQIRPGAEPPATVPLRVVVPFPRVMFAGE